MSIKSDDLDYITDVMKQKRQDSEKTTNIKKYKNKININNNNQIYYRIGPKKIHKNITLDEKIVKWVQQEAKEYKLNFSEAVNQILRFSYENSKNKKIKK